jgi:hypothetical protein
MSEDYKKPFIPIWMDQAGFTPHQFRVLAHLWSRGQGRCFPSLDTIAKSCGIRRGTVCAALKALEAVGCVTRIKRKTKGVRFANEYLLTGTFGTPVEIKPGRMEHQLTGTDGAPANRDVWDTGNDTSRNESSGNDTSLFPGEILPMAESIPLKKSQLQELAESIYQEYPRKTAKDNAIKAILKAMKENNPAFLLERTKAYSSAIGWKERQFIPYPAKWFNEERFNDDPEEWKQPSGQTSKPISESALGGRASQQTETEKEQFNV